MLVILGQGGGGVSQSVIHQTLDVCAPVISRMLDSMEERGLVERTDHPFDGRRYWVRLTRDGVDVLRHAAMDLLYCAFTERALRTLIAPGATRPRTIARAMERVRAYCVRQRPVLTDRSTMRYPAYFGDGTRNPDFPVRRPEDEHSPRRRAT